MKPARTQNQKLIMGVVLEAADAGRFYTIKELHAALPYTCDYGSLRTSLRFLKKTGIVVTEPAGQFKLVKPTSAAYAWFRAG